MQSSRLGFVMFFACATAPACSSDEPMHADATIAPDKDLGVADIFDAGRISLCPIEDNPSCTRASDCGMQDEMVSACPGCAAYNTGVCATAMCEDHPRLEGGDVYTLISQVPPTINAKSFSGHILASKTSGGNTLTCDDVYAAAPFSLDEPCFNIIDTRRYGQTAQVGDTYRLPFTQFPSGMHVLFVVHAYDAEGTSGNRIGLSCKEWDIEMPGGGVQQVPGDTMRRL